MVSDRDEIVEASQQLAGAIGRRDLSALANYLAVGFVHRTHGGTAVDAEGFIRGIEQIPGEILAVTLERLDVDLVPTGALVTGIQHAQVRVEGQVVDDRRGFVDWFVKQAGTWRIQAAVDLPQPE
jgi:ketosteroid isomerase-like protein